MRRGLTWGLTLPLVLGGTELAHSLAYRIVYPQSHEHVLVATGHAYLAWLPLVLGVTGAIALAALAAAAIDAAHGRSPRELPAWAFAALPPAAFVLQEALELSLHLGTFGWRAVLAPTFVPGLLLQLPLSLCAFVIARIALRTAERVGRALAPLRVAPAFVVPARAAYTPPYAGFAASARSSRGPPRVVAAV